MESSVFATPLPFYIGAHLTLLEKLTLKICDLKIYVLPFRGLLANSASVSPQPYLGEENWLKRPKFLLLSSFPCRPPHESNFKYPLYLGPLFWGWFRYHSQAHFPVVCVAWIRHQSTNSDRSMWLLWHTFYYLYLLNIITDSRPNSNSVGPSGNNNCFLSDACHSFGPFDFVVIPLDIFDVYMIF